MIITIVILLWVLFMARAVIAEYKYYQVVKMFEPEIWQALGQPKFLMIPIMFVSGDGLNHLKGATDKRVCRLAIKHRQAGKLFIFYVVFVLLASVVFFKFA